MFSSGRGENHFCHLKKRRVSYKHVPIIFRLKLVKLIVKKIKKA